MSSDNSTFTGKIATGAKKRTIKASDVSINSPFLFNKSITPHGGTKGSVFISTTKKGYAIVELFQDLNKDGVIKRKERIYKGKCLDRDSADELQNFYGDIKLKKTMHNCSWQTEKNPDKVGACTMELIPTVYSLTLQDESNKIFDFQSLGSYKSPGIVLGEHLNNSL